MRILIAPDKFKGTLTARQAAAAIARGWRSARPEDQLERLPISDGGDGFGAVLAELLHAHPRRVKTVDAAQRSCCPNWWFRPRTKTAVIESANIIGLAMLPKGKFHPFELDTFGLGAVLRAADRAGAKQVIVGIGGSATNDGGFGLARSLGWVFLNQARQPIESWRQLDSLAEVRRPGSSLRAEVIVATDVHNPLLGVRGASRIYGPQKGLRPEDFAHAERCLRRLALLLKRQHGLDFARVAGAGAAGGLGFGLMSFAGAQVQPGFALVAKYAGLERRLRQTDVVVTGEGAIDRTTAMGKGCGQIARLCRELKIPCLGLGGCVVPTRALAKEFVALAGLTDLTTTANALQRPAFWLQRLSRKTAANLICKPAARR